MGWFKRDKVVDLTEEYIPRKIKSVSTPPAGQSQTSPGNFFNFFGNSNPENASSSQTNEQNKGPDSINPDEKRRRLAKRLKDMTDRIEDLSNQIYLLQQRFEVIEKKINVNSYE